MEPAVTVEVTVGQPPVKLHFTISFAAWQQFVTHFMAYLERCFCPKHGLDHVTGQFVETTKQTGVEEV